MGILFIVLIAGILIYRSFAKEKELTRYTATFLDVFDTRTEIVGFAKDKEKFAEDAQLIKDRLIYYNQLYDIYNDYPGVNNIKTIKRHNFCGKKKESLIKLLFKLYGRKLKGR